MAISATPHEHGTLLLFTNLFTYNDIYIQHKITHFSI